MSIIKWIQNTGNQSALGSGLNSLGNGSLVASAALDNTSNLDLYADWVYQAKYAAGPPAAGTKVADLYLLPSPDGSNYPDITVVPQKALLIASFECRNPSTSVFEFLVATGVSIPPLLFKVVLVNTSGQALAASGNTLTFTPYKLQNV